MRAGKMYRIKNLSQNKLNTVMRMGNRWHPTGESAPELMTEQPTYLSAQTNVYRDGDVVACIGTEMRETHHYERQPFYKVVTLTGEIGYVTKGTRNKYFELVRQ